MAFERLENQSHLGIFEHDSRFVEAPAQLLIFCNHNILNNGFHTVDINDVPESGSSSAGITYRVHNVIDNTQTSGPPTSFWVHDGTWVQRFVFHESLGAPSARHHGVGTCDHVPGTRSHSALPGKKTPFMTLAMMASVNMDKQTEPKNLWMAEPLCKKPKRTKPIPDIKNATIPMTTGKTGPNKK
ncbi:MAG: hypothetical protein VX768_21260 [Planctomycetota bacterium]|nr:hypothetical protein [Planctomycetota bacterium]